MSTDDYRPAFNFAHSCVLICDVFLLDSILLCNVFIFVPSMDKAINLSSVFHQVWHVRLVKLSWVSGPVDKEVWLLKDRWHRMRWDEPLFVPRWGHFSHILYTQHSAQMTGHSPGGAHRCRSSTNSALHMHSCRLSGNILTIAIC